MSRGYGLDLYGIPFYGYSQPEDYSVSPFTAQQTDYGKISLFWSSPNSTPWKFLELVRSTSGYPSIPSDGTVLLEISSSSMVRTYDDVDVTPGSIYYYTMFIAIDAPAYSASVTYQENAQVLYNGQYWGSLQNGNIGNTPSVGSAFWQSASFIPVWYPAGYVATMALANQGYGTRLYQRTPQPYKIDTSDTFTNTSVDNPSLQHYLNVFGFGLDILKNAYDSLLSLNDPSKISAYNLDILGRQFGLTTDYLSSPSQRRQRITNVSVNYQMKGQTQSIHNLIAELSGWNTQITYGPNLMVSADQSAFVHPIYDQWSPYTLYKLNQFVQYNGYNYECALVQVYGQAQAPSGTATSNTWWTLSQQVLNTATNFNPSTGGQSTWSINSTTVPCAVSGVLTGLPHPVNTTINNWNGLASVQTGSFNTGSYDLFSISDLAPTTWSTGVNYIRGNYVTYTDGYTYKALKSSGPTTIGSVIPGRDNSVWEAVYYLTGDVPNKYTDTAPLAVTSRWSATVAYTPGQLAAYNGNIYRCALANKNTSPGIGYYSSKYWTFISSNQDTYLLSTYAAHVNTSSSSEIIFIGIIPLFYSANGILLNNTASNLTGYGVSQFAYTARFATDYPDLNGTGEASLYNATNEETLETGTWVSNPATANLWRSSYGMASVNPTQFTANTYSVLLIQHSPQHAGTTQMCYGRYGLTLANDYTNSAQLTHGFVFAYKDINNFYYVTRTSLRKVTAGVDTILSSWTRLSTGDRIVVDVNANICVYKYKRTGDGALQILANSIGTGPVTVSGNYYSGLIHKYSPTGDL